MRLRRVCVDTLLVKDKPRALAEVEGSDVSRRSGESCKGRVRGLIPDGRCAAPGGSGYRSKLTEDDACD